MDVQIIPIDQIIEDPEQPRKHHSDESLQGLADSIRQHGLFGPITVTHLPTTDRYKIVTGERRWRAAKIAKLQTMPCIVKDLDSDERITVQLIENLQREDLQPLEKAKAIQQIRSTLGSTNREIAQRLGLSERSVGYLLDLLNLPEEIGEAIVSSPNRPADGQLTEKHARSLKQLNDSPELQSRVVERVRDERLSSEDTANLVKALKKKPNNADEIMDAPTDHLVRFFKDTDPAADFLNSIEVADAPGRLSPMAQRIIDFLPILESVDLESMGHPEMRQLEDALTSLKLGVDALLRGCKSRLGG